MKKILILCSFMLMGMISFAQQTPAPVQVPKFALDEVTKQVTYTEAIVEVGVKDTLYYRALAWINKFFKNPIDVTKVRDQANGKIECQHRITLMNTDEAGNKIKSNKFIVYKLIIEVKDAKYRYKLTDFHYLNPSKQPMENWLDKKNPQYGPVCDTYLVQVDEFVKDLTKKLKQGMKPPVVKKDDW